MWNSLNDINFDDLEGDPKLDKSLNDLMAIFWQGFIFSDTLMYCEVDIEEASILYGHWFDSVKSLNDHKKDMIAKLEELPFRAKNSSILILNNIISMMDVILKIAKYNCTVGSSSHRITPEYGHRFIDLVYTFYYTHLITQKFKKVIEVHIPGHDNEWYLDSVITRNIDNNGVIYFGK